MNLKIPIKSLFLFYVLAIALPILFLLLGVDILLVITIEVFVICFTICFKYANKNVFFICFLASFFVFLISGDLAEELFDKHYWLQFGADATIHAHVCILISLIFLTIGYFLTKSPIENPYNSDNQDTKIISLRRTSLYIYYATFGILLFDTINKAFFVAANGYISYYTSYSSILPNVIVQLGDFAPIALCSFLATLPSKKECKLPLIMYAIYAICGLLMGQRGALVYNMLFIIAYMFYRNKIENNNEVWISKRAIRIMILSLPVLIVFLYIYGFTRSGLDYSFDSIGDTIVSFFVNIGASSKVIKAGYVYQNEIPRFRLYSLGDTLNYFKYSKIFTVFTGVVYPGVHTADYALNSYSFDAFISYKYMTSNFLNGGGAGSSFIACLFADFGYFGVAIGSFLYGFVFKKISSINPSNWLVSSMKLYAMLFLIKSPRGSFDGAIGGIINFTYIFTMLLIYFLATSKNSRVSYSKNTSFFKKI